jgi:hypothetical protein
MRVICHSSIGVVRAHIIPGRNASFRKSLSGRRSDKQFAAAFLDCGLHQSDIVLDAS